MKVGEIFADEETKNAATEFAMRCIIESGHSREDCDTLRDAFIAGVVWKQMKEKDENI